MEFTLTKDKSMLLLWIIVIVVSSCKQSEFYDKTQLLDAKKSKSDNTEPIPEKSKADENVVVYPPEVLPPEVLSPEIFPSETPLPTTIPPISTTPQVDIKQDGPLLEVRSEFFVQESNRDGDVDVLFMIDNSGSMANKQKRLSESLSLFIDKFLDKKINFKMAITTSDGTKFQSGKMIGDANKLTSDYLKIVGKTKFMNYFSQITKVGIDGPGVEQGLKTSAAFFDRYSSSFLRNDAYLALVEISDEEDQSEKVIKEYVTKYQSLKKNKGMVKIYSIVSLRLPMDNTLSDSIGERYVEASKLTGGTYSDIKDDFSTILTDLGTSIVNLVDSFALAEEPANTDIQIYVNKILINSGWSYSPISRSIKFDSNNIPKAGSQIEIRYKVKVKTLGVI